MNFRWIFHLRQMVVQAALGSAGIAAITAVCYPLHLDFAVVGCLFLLVVVLESAFAGFAACAFVSVVAVASLDFFFVPPLLSLQIAQPVYGLALITFLATALVITRLASKAREEARNADARRKDFSRLYELSSRLVSVHPKATIKEYLGIFRDIYGLRAVCLFDGAAAAVGCDGGSEYDLASRTREAYISDRDYYEDENKITIRCLRVAGRPIGAVGFAGLRDAESTAGPLSMLAAAMIQRAHYFETASEAAAAAQVEVLRTAILDAFAHQFKTPLAAILTAAGSLREIGPLVPEQRDMVETIESQVAGLGRLTTRLLRMARLDRDEIRPRLQVTDLFGLVARIADQYRKSCDNTLLLHVAKQPVEVLSDPEMLSLAVIQLVDNAFRYAQPASPIAVTVNSEAGFAMVRVTNEGDAIPPEEQSRIFDRFYRGATGHHAPGTGLGLYVARKIILAHGGTLELDNEHVYGPNTTFYLKLPVAKDEREHELNASQSLGCR
jgi:two-component system sensor histidine kinase KdpD